MYRTGLLVVHRDKNYTPLDTRTDDYRRIDIGDVYLPHSCDEWVIGGPAEIKQLINDLEAVLSGDYKPVKEDDE